MTSYKVYLEHDGQRTELGSGEFTEESPAPARGKFAEIHKPLETDIFPSKIKITLKTFISFQSGIYVKHHNAFALIPTKDLVWNNNEEAAYVWEGLDESSTFTWHNYLKDWGLTVDWLWRAKMNEINLDTNKSLKEIFQTIPAIYSRLYTGTCVNADGTPAENNTIIEIETKKFQYRKDGEAAYYQWGWPGPDYNIYSRENYGKDWAFTKQEMERIVK